MRLLSQIKNDMEFNRGLYNLIDALGKISVSQYYMLEKKTRAFDKIYAGLEELFSIANASGAHSPLVRAQNRPMGVIAVTSDSGLLGGLNMQVMNAAAREVKEQGARLIVIGEKGRYYAQENNLSCVSFEGIHDDARFSQAQQLRDYILNEALSLRIGAVKIIYAYSVSVVSQKVQALTLLPIAKREGASGIPTDMIIESSLNDIVEYLVSILLGNKFYEIFGLARLAELSARFMHLENSKTKIDELNKHLRLQYFRQKHEMADRTMRELFSARMAFQHGS